MQYEIDADYTQFDQKGLTRGIGRGRERGD